MGKMLPHRLEGSATDGQVLTTVSGKAAWAAPSGGGGGGIREALNKFSGALTVGVGATRLYNDTGAPWTITSVRATVETAPSGGTVVVDVNIDGTTIFTTQASRPAIAAGAATSGKVTSAEVTSVPDGSYITIDVDATSSPAANLTVTLVLS